MTDDSLVKEIEAADDNRLVEMVRGNYGPGGNAAIQAEMTRRLLVALDRSARASDRSGRILIALTVVLVILTIVLIVRG
jgi:hypothetical protein